ncbi:arginine deiminase family protein [Sphingobacterium sp. LRF_L2]|uniref:arginine deiminase family protein n=1 Tax=Sphingobacterium sp. LRF_L2 TaxID=3369421 RepID=UPI003F62EC17
MINQNKAVFVSSETGRLRRVLVHSPDSGLGKVVPSKAQDWLFEDIVHLDTIRKNEYDLYTKILLYFLDPDKIKGRLAQIDSEHEDRRFYKPGMAEFFSSDRVVELQELLIDVLQNESIKQQLVSSVCAIEACTFELQQEMLAYSAADLARLFFTGALQNDQLIFAPIPNFIFTRDIGIVINDFILLNKPMKEARKREALLAKYIFFHHPLFIHYRDNVLELTESPHQFLRSSDELGGRVTLEGGDVMVVSADHVLVGVSERTSKEAAAQVTKLLFERNVVRKVTVVQIPSKRDYMHIDTVFTQVAKEVWVMLGDFCTARIKGRELDAVDRTLDLRSHVADQLRITQFEKGNEDKPRTFTSLEELLIDISVLDLDQKKEDVKIILSGNAIFPYDAREQWTDSCNLLALKDGVVLGYDRNDMTVEAFRQAGFAIIKAQELIDGLEEGTLITDAIERTLILMPSAELSRARGGFHCMSMPLLRD